MPFNVELTFTGLMALVLDGANAPTKACYVVPNGEVPFDAGPIDGKRLRRHRLYLEFPLANLPGPPPAPAGVNGIWLLGDQGARRRVTFEIEGAANDFSVGDLSTVAPLPTIAPGLSWPDPSTLQWGAPASVVAQIMFNRGSLVMPVPLTELRSWVIPNTLSRQLPIVRTLTHQLVLTLRNLTAFKVVTRKLSDRSPSGNLALQAGDGQTIKITLANLCDENPLRWPVEARDPTVDEDFRWYYQLLSKTDQERVGSALGGLELPVPHPVAAPMGQGMNCLKGSGAPQVFVLD